MKDFENDKTEYEKYFIEGFDIKKISFIKKIRLIPKVIYNFDAQKKLQKLIDKKRPDVAHLHNICHYLTPSILHTLKKNNIPIVLKLLDYKTICPNRFLFAKGKICQKCIDKNYYHCFLEKCVDDSRMLSFIAMVEAYVHKLAKSFDNVSLFLAPSIFMKKKSIEFGIKPERIKILRNTIDINNFKEAKKFKEENYILYYGRISEEKGIEDLIMSYGDLLKNSETKIAKLKIVGSGSQVEELRAVISKNNLDKQIELIGYMKGEHLYNFIRNSKFVILPSVWFDNSPLIISETQLLGKPVIVSDSGGSKEMIIDGETGSVFKSGDRKDLIKKMKKMFQLSKIERKKMGERGRENIKKINNEDFYYKKLISYYNEAIESNKV